MNVSKEKVYDVLNDQLQYIGDDTSNWSWKIYFQDPSKPWSSKDIERFIKLFQNFEEFIYELNNDILEVETVDGPLMLIIDSLQSISEYCQNDYFEVVSHKWIEKHILTTKEIEKHYDLNIESVITKSQETNIDETTIQWQTIPKYYSQSKRMVFKNKKNNFNIIFEYNKKSTESFTLMKDADLASMPYNINIYMETTDKVVKENTSIMISQMVFVMQQLINDEYLLTQDQQKAILNKYTQLISSVRELNKYEKQNPTPYFLAPKPVTLEKKNLIDPDTTYGVVSILKNYAVTDKADGERMLLYIDEQGEAYLINNTYNVKKTGLVVQSNQLHQSLFDGEYIPKELLKDDSEFDIFAVFDVYFIQKESVMHLPLMATGKPNRYQKMQMALQDSYWNNGEVYLKVEMKAHYYEEGKSIFKKCKDILENPKRRYDIDGLVFTPIDLPVFAYYPNQFKKLKGKSVAWDRVFKWKPADQNTIDFLVKMQPDEYVDVKENKRYKRFKLFTGYNASQWEEISVWKGMQKVFQREKKAPVVDDYQAKLFKPINNYHPNISIAFLPVNAAGQAVTHENTIVEDNMIVEFAYDRDGKQHASMKWLANRVREDKTRAFRMTGGLSKTANDLKVALNIWQNIYDPVTYEHIIGESTVDINQLPSDIEERLLGTNDVYYARDIPRNHMLSVHMLNFHNYGIKSYLYERPENRDSLLELACGMAGDLPRWRDSRYNFILGVDLVKDNIESAQGAYGRYLHQRTEFLKYHRQVQRVYYPQAIFLIGDCALPLESGDAAKGKDLDSEQLLKLLYMGKVTEKYSYLNQYRIPGRASRKFDVVSCQFAIHYFFKTKDLLDGFLRNVSYNLKPNGKFITTFMDGQKVHQMINKEGSAKGVKEDHVVWCIQKQYKSFNKANIYGRLIDVYLENTNHFIPEYLVHFDMLKEKALEFGLEIVEDGFFSDTFEMLKQKIVQNDPNRNRFLDKDIMILDKDPVQTRFSFINRWAIFRKMDQREMTV